MLLSNITTFKTAYFQADFFGKLIFLFLFALSSISWIFLLHRIWVYKQVKKESMQFQKIVNREKEKCLHLNIDKGNSPFHHIFSTLKHKTIEILDKNRFFTKEIANGGINHLSQNDIHLIESHLVATISKQKDRLDKNLFVLSTITTLAPFLGLLGTVWGILITFFEMEKGGMIGSNTAILGGLSTALVTTVLGLIIAIPSLISYSYLKNAGRLYTSDMQDFSHSLLSTVELQYRKVDIDK